MKVHPVANMLPMLSEAELADLAEDIKANGQIHEIVTAVIDDEETLLDGRNRLRACQLAGVEPRIKKLNGENPVAFIISANARRDITMGQRAIWAAQASPHVAKSGRRKNGPETDHFPLVNKQRLSEARVIAEFAPDLATQIIAKTGDVSFTDAYAKARQRRTEKQDNEAAMAMLREEAPDLADLAGISLAQAVAQLKQRRADEAQLATIEEDAPDLVALVREGRMSVADALAAHADREAKKQAAQQGATMLLSQVVALLGVGDVNPQDAAAQLMRNVNRKMWPGERIDELTPEYLAACGNMLLACALLLAEAE